MTQMREQFNAAYWAAQHPDVQALSGMEPFSVERQQRAIELAQEGHLIDPEIMALGHGNPYEVQRLREWYGYTWYPGVLMPGHDPLTRLAPGIGGIPGDVYDPTHIPFGALKVSTRLEDYPPFAPPVIAEKPKVTQLVGPRMVADRYSPVAGDDSPAGTEYQDSRGRFVKVVVVGPFGGWTWWEKKA